MYCPYCNSSLDGVSTPRCPRCDERLPEAILANLPPRPATTPPPTEPPPPGKAVTLKFILGGMAGMAALALIFILSTQSYRRNNDFKKGHAHAAPTSEAPGDWSALGLVPARCNFLAGIDLADLRRNPDAAKAFLQSAALVPVADFLRGATGLSLDAIDQIAIGVEMTDKLPRAYLLVQTRANYDANEVLKKIGPKQSLRNRPAATQPLGKFGEAVVWCLGDRHIAILLRLEPGPLDDLQAIPPRPRIHLEGSPETLRTLVNERVSRQSLAWAAGDLSSAAGLADLATLFAPRVAGLPTLLNSRGFTISLSLTAEREWQIFAQAEAASPRHADELEKLLSGFDWGSPKSLKFDASAPPWVQTQVRYELGKLLGNRSE